MAGSGFRRYVEVGLKSVLVVVASYMAMTVGNLLSRFIAMSIGGIGVRMVGAVLCGLVAGGLAAMLGFRRCGALLSAVYASLPMLFSWFVRGSRTTRSSYVYRDGQMVSVGTREILYGDLAVTLAISAAISIAVFVCCRAMADRGVR